MKIYRGTDDPTLKKRARSVAIGIFDGVHLGHQRILKKLVTDARSHRRRAMVVTFDPHPVKVLAPERPHPILMSLEHRLRVLERLGVQEALVIPFDRKFAGIAHESFLTEHLIGRLGAKALVVGHDFRFGHGGQGSVDYLKRNSKALGYRVYPIDALKHGSSVISSTQIRRLIDRGALARAERMLGRPVSVYGDVVKGKGRGRALGFPTANINPHHETLPPSGVYAVRGRFGRRRLGGVMHIGARPTFGERDRSVEVHFMNARLSLYGRELELEFVRKLRPIKHFKTRQALQTAIRRDISRAERLLF